MTTIDARALRSRAYLTCAFAIIAFAWSRSVRSHSFVEPYLLPVPFSLYVYACAATLVLTFAVLGYFVHAGDGVAAADASDRRPAPALRIPNAVIQALRVVAFAALALAIVAGIVGTADPLSNIAMLLFWMVFMLGFTYVTAIAGDSFAALNPWRSIVSCIERAMPGFANGRLRYPAWLGYWPALAFYEMLIWIELFVLPKPVTLSVALTVYTLCTLLAVFVFGASTWFRYGEFFSVFFRLVGGIAPLAYRRADNGSWLVQLSAPLAGLNRARPEHLSLVLFILFMLSSTTYDAMHETDLWVSLYWQYLVPLAQPLWGTDVVKAQRTLIPWYEVYQRAGLLLSPLFYFAIYVSLVECARRIAGTTLPLRRLLLEFAPSLVPIAVVYNATHYYTMLWLQVGRLDRTLSDPFGWGWNLLALGTPEPSPPIDMGLVWHTQVALILIGHLASVYLAHAAALRVFPTRRQAIASQIPLLVLMIAYTAIGLYILSLPLASPVFREG